MATQSPTPPSPLFSVDFRTDVRKVLITDVAGIGQTADFRALILARISSVGYFAMVWCAIEFSSVIIVCVSTVARHYKTEDHKIIVLFPPKIQNFFQLYSYYFHGFY